MTAMSEIGKEYGTALFMLAAEIDQTKEYGRALCVVRDAYLEDSAYVELLASPGIPQRERLGVIDTTFGEIVPEHVLSYMKLMCEKGRMSCFMESVEEYLSLLDASERVIHAKVTTAVLLTDAEKNKLVQNLAATYRGSVQAEYRIDESILGGVIVEADGKIMDGSLRHRLDEVKDVMKA